MSRFLVCCESRVVALAPVLRLLRRGLFFGSELVMELLVADMKELLAARRNGVGSARRIFCDVGIALVGGEACEPPKVFICDGGIHGASK